jgi:hypothetical protein
MDPDALAPQPSPQLRDVVGLVGVKALWLEVASAVGVMSRSVTLDHGFQLAAVVDVGGGETEDEGQSVRVRQDVHLGTRLAPVHGARTCVFAPFSARTCAEFSTTRETSTRSASSSRCATASCSRPQTPALDQIMNRRCTVDFDTPEQGGNARQAQPLTST